MALCYFDSEVLFKLIRCNTESIYLDPQIPMIDSVCRVAAGITSSFFGHDYTHCRVTSDLTLKFFSSFVIDDVPDEEVMSFDVMREIEYEIQTAKEIIEDCPEDAEEEKRFLRNLKLSLLTLADSI